jgi:hypothetical protein
MTSWLQDDDEWLTHPRAPLRFAVSIRRWEWRLGEDGGEPCLLPKRLVRKAAFTGHAGLLPGLLGIATRDNESILDFVNSNAGLYVPAWEPDLLVSAPRPERLDRMRLELRALLVLEELVTARANYLSSPEIYGRRYEAAKDGATEFLSGALRLLRDAVVPDGGNAIDEWLRATVRNEWIVTMPSWQEQDPETGAWPWPEVRCRTLLGYAYAQLTALAARSYFMVEDTLEVESLARRCAICGDVIPRGRPYGASAGWPPRAVRSDRRYCFSQACRRTANRLVQRRRRRQGAGVEEPSSDGGSRHGSST